MSHRTHADRSLHGDGVVAVKGKRDNHELGSSNQLRGVGGSPRDGLSVTRIRAHVASHHQARVKTVAQHQSESETTQCRRTKHPGRARHGKKPRCSFGHLVPQSGFGAVICALSVGFPFVCRHAPPTRCALDGGTLLMLSEGDQSEAIMTYNGHRMAHTGCLVGRKLLVATVLGSS